MTLTMRQDKAPVRLPLSPRRRASRAAAVAVAAALWLGGCGQGDLFARFPERESATVEAAAWPTLVDGVTRLQAAGPGPDPADGAVILDSLGAEAAWAQAEAERLGSPVVESAALTRDADAVRAGR